MFLKNILEGLALSTLNNWSGVEKGEIKPAFKAQVVNAVNEALIQIYSEIIVEEKAIYLNYKEGMTNYELTPEHMVEDREAPDHKHYLMLPPGEKFSGDIMKILSITSVDGEALPLNNLSNPASAFTPTYNKIQIPCGRENEVFCITYQPHHVIVKESEEETEDIFLPLHLYPLLKDYVGFTIYNSINTEAASYAATKHYQAYINHLRLIKDMDLMSQSYSQDSSKFRQNGWI